MTDVDTTVIKVSSEQSPTGDLGQTYLASGKSVAMRMWRDLEPGEPRSFSAREYETVGYVVSGRATLEIEGQSIRLEPGDSWVVPPNARHAYTIEETFTAVEATTPPAHVHGRDEPEGG